MHKYEYINSAIRINVPEYKESKIEGTTVFFIIKVSNKNKEWLLEKRFSEFDNLVKALKANYANLPALPGKTFLFKMTDKDLEQRRSGLEDFLQALVCRNDLLNSEQVKQFLQLGENASESIVNPPRLQDEFSIGGAASKGVRDFTYVKEDDTFYIVTGDMNPVSRLNAYVTNAKMPWEKDTGAKEKVLMEVGSIECWRGTGSNFSQAWSKNYPSQAISLEYSGPGERALVGLDDGILDILKVSPTGFEDLICVKIHQNRIMGISYDNINGIVYSISEDKTFRISEANSLMMILSLPHREPLLVMTADKTNKRVFIGSKGGEIFIYDVSSVTIEISVRNIPPSF